MNKTRKNHKRHIIFSDHPDFTPNLTPREMFLLGSFGGTYWRPIYSSVNKKNYKTYTVSIPNHGGKTYLKRTYRANYDIQKNKYKCKVGLGLDYWESHGWIHPRNPYGWVHWYCDFYRGKRCEDDERQIERWKGLAGPRGRFMRFLVTQILRKRKME